MDPISVHVEKDTSWVLIVALVKVNFNQREFKNSKYKYEYSKKILMNADCSQTFVPRVAFAQIHQALMSVHVLWDSFWIAQGFVKVILFC